jgi:hypothetical protein
MFETVDVKPNIIFFGADDSRGLRFLQYINYEVSTNYSRFIIYRTIIYSKLLFGIYTYEFNLN